MKRTILVVLLVVSPGCAGLGRGPSQNEAVFTPLSTSAAATADPFPSTYARFPSRPTLIRGGTVMTAAGQVIPNGQLLLVDGKIVAVGAQVDAPANVVVIDATGKWVTPGVIDSHSHLGAMPSPLVTPTLNVNELTDPNTAEVFVEHSIWAQDPGFIRALEAGVTTIQILPGSGNLFGGRSVTLKNVPARTVQAMKFPGAPYGLKMACGENPAGIWGPRGRAPGTRMANVAGQRAAWIRAAEYRRRWDDWVRGGAVPASMPARDLELETLAGALRGDILVHIHCYRAEEMAEMIDVAKEFGYQIRSFHHGVEAYKVRDLLARAGISASLWADWWGFKMEALDFTKANVALVHSSGARAIVHSDDPMGIQRLNQEAAKALLAGRQAGLQISDDEALRWITANPAWSLGLQDRVGTLEPGKEADVVIWSHTPFSVYARADMVFIDGALLYDRSNPALQPSSDFEVGIPVASGAP